MTAEQLHAVRRMKSMPTLLEFEASNIDAEAGVLRDVVMVQEGPAKGHGVHLEAEFVANLVAYDQSNFGSRGVKARLGHPGLSDDAQGTQMGYMRNVRKRKNEEGKMQAIADLHLLEAAEESPTKPGMRSWVLKMSSEAPDFIMSSIVFQPSGYYQRKPNGNKHRLEYDYETETWNIHDEWGNIYAEFDAAAGAAHYYTDLVEAGAATDSLFSNQANPHLLVARFGEWLDENPDIRNFIKQHPDKVQAFLDRIGFQSSKKTTLKMGLKELFFGKEKPEAEVTLSAEEIQALRDNVAKADSALAEADTKVEALTEELKSLRSGLAETEKHREALGAKVAELEKKAADVHTRVPAKDETSGDQDEKSWTKDPINQRAARAFSAIRKKATA